MKNISKVLWVLCAISFLMLIAARFVLGGWQNYLILPLVLFVVSLTLALLADVKLYIEFFSMRTTKNGMSMGLSMFLALILLIAVNILSLKRDMVFDLSSGSIHSLSEQSKEILKGLKEPLKITYFYNGQKNANIKMAINNLVGMYKTESPFVEHSNIDAYIEKIKADKYLKGIRSSQQVMLFIDYKDKRVRVESPISESTITTALIRATRVGQRKKIAFLQGHGEKDLNLTEDAGLSYLKQALISAAFEVKSFNLIQGNELPDADVIAVVGPIAEVFKDEQQQLLNFSKKGGGLLIAVDPAERHKMADLLKEYGINYNNDFILNEKSKVSGRGVSSAFGALFAEDLAITKNFNISKNFVLFDLASSLTPIENTKFKVTPIVKSAPTSFVMKSLNDDLKSEMNYFTMGLLSEGIFDDSKATSRLVAYGDSDFLSNKDIIQGLNMDLAINSIAYLAQEKDLVNIKPKTIPGNKLFLTSMQQNGIIIFCIFIPVFFFVFSLVLWIRRRSM